MKASLCFVGRKFGNPASAARSRRNSAVSSPEDSSSTPTKPGDIITAAEGSASGHDQGSPSSIPVNRLVITGKNGTVVVDHRWAVTQHVGSEATTTTAEEWFETSATDPTDGTTTGSTTVHDSSLNKPRKKKRTRTEVRFSPVDNPPLNRDCVIAYAETSSTDANKPILRQVRSQRVGVFDEDHVVFAARFFVPGD
ncbi:hypothetical protein IQ07DRAFT_590069 [Pyrenochaeta sp. DS3sAY3a]|nr:hypothetical protein IQ07DRAFT_590069 [Pyrenochaeta sp. DS3sAY3a]